MSILTGLLHIKVQGLDIVPIVHYYVHNGQEYANLALRIFAR